MDFGFVESGAWTWAGHSFTLCFLRNMAVDMSAEISDQNEQLDIITLKVCDINRTIYMSVFKEHTSNRFPGPLESGK